LNLLHHLHGLGNTIIVITTICRSPQQCPRRIEVRDGRSSPTTERTVSTTTERTVSPTTETSRTDAPPGPSRLARRWRHEGDAVPFQCDARRDVASTACSGCVRVLSVEPHRAGIAIASRRCSR